MRLALFLFALVVCAPAVGAQRTYWPVSLDSAAIGQFRKHTHVAVTGKVARVTKETDGDVHIELLSPSGAFIIAECIPELPCALPKVGSTITVRGISRRDAEHLWFECHPVESISSVTARK